MCDREPALEMREAEASFQAIVDPYARADFFIAFGEEGVDLEEGFITFPTLPGGLLMKVGKMRAAFGKVNTFHTHQLPWTDRPLVTENLVGGEEGIADAGLSVARLIPNRGSFSKRRARSSAAIRRMSSRRTSGRISATSAICAAIRTSPNRPTSTSAGRTRAVTIASGALVDDPDPGRFTTTLFGVDATLRWRPLRRSIYRSFVGRSELVWSRREQPDGRQDGAGFFVSGDYQFAPPLVRGRAPRSVRPRRRGGLARQGGSVLLTYWPSEFSQIRGQYRRTDVRRRPDGERVPVPVPVFDWGARRASVLAMTARKARRSHYETANISQSSIAMLLVIGRFRAARRAS